METEEQRKMLAIQKQFENEILNPHKEGKRKLSLDDCLDFMDKITNLDE